MAEKIEKFTYASYNVCLYLESLNLSYKQMIDYFEIKITENDLARKFREYKIHHKTKSERIIENVRTDTGSIHRLAKRYKVSPKTISNIRRRLRDDNGKV